MALLFILFVVALILCDENDVPNTFVALIFCVLCVMCLFFVCSRSSWVSCDLAGVGGNAKRPVVCGQDGAGGVPCSSGKEPCVF